MRRGVAGAAGCLDRSGVGGSPNRQGLRRNDHTSVDTLVIKAAKASVSAASTTIMSRLLLHSRTFLVRCRKEQNANANILSRRCVVGSTG